MGGKGRWTLASPSLCLITGVAALPMLMAFL